MCRVRLRNPPVPSPYTVKETLRSKKAYFQISVDSNLADIKFLTGIWLHWQMGQRKLFLCFCPCWELKLNIFLNFENETNFHIDFLYSSVTYGSSSRQICLCCSVINIYNQIKMKIGPCIIKLFVNHRCDFARWYCGPIVVNNRALTPSALCFKFLCVVGLTHRLSNCSRV